MPNNHEHPQLERPWRGQAQDEGSLHCLGNGALCAYEQGPDIAQVFGPPYSSPTFAQLRCQGGPGLQAVSTHEPGRAIWRHQLFLDGAPVGELLDFVDSRLPCLARRARLSQPLNLRLILEVPCRQTPKTLPGAAGGLIFEVPAGLYFFHEYPAPLPAFYQLAWQGAVQCEADPQGGDWLLTCPAGESSLFLAGSPAYPQAVTAAEQALQVGFDALLERTRRAWDDFCRPHRAAAAAAHPQLFQALEETALLIKAQQGIEGGILAGNVYHWAGVRDQYGVGRGLLAMGHITEARAILQFYWDIWQRHGRLHNGMGIGAHAFHVHENDLVEITGYLVLQAFDLLAASGDEAFVETIFPMLDWAFQGQVSQLVEGMLPFNGDETYVAGGILPRSALNDGSAEATLLFLRGGEQLADWAERAGRWDAGQLAQARQALAQARRGFRENFYPEGVWLTNQPRRAQCITPPRFRHGVCERCLVEPSRPIAAIWTERSASGRYLCQDCLARGEFAAYVPRAYQLNSVGLAPLYFGSDLATPQELAPLVREAVARYDQTGRLPSRPDEPGGLAVGYDYGLLLYAMSILRLPEAGRFCQVVLGLRDPAGAWAEYYRAGQPVGSRCRPWESAINLEASLKWAALDSGPRQD